MLLRFEVLSDGVAKSSSCFGARTSGGWVLFPLLTFYTRVLLILVSGRHRHGIAPFQTATF